MDHSETSGKSTDGGLLPVFLVVAALYFTREVCILLALAVLLAFLLKPLARRFELLHFGKIGSALASVFIAFLPVAILSWLVAGQLSDFAGKVPQYEKSIHAKMQQIQSGAGGSLGRTAKSIQDLQNDLTPTNIAAPTNAPPVKGAKTVEIKPMPVEVRAPELTPVQFLKTVLGPIFNVAATLFVVTIICIFILAGREDLRARLLRIVGSRNKRLTNQVLSETGARVSRYLLMQLIVNSTYGVPIGLGLWAIGIPNPLLWGMIAALFRYIPYAGPWIAAALPTAIAWATSPGWVQPVLVLSLFAVVEIITANLVEPLLYGNTAGLTPLAVLLSAVFWTWVWGPAGLLLSMPLTVCLVSMGRHVPQLELLDQMFGENEPGKE